tara:strand:- start:448 stop:654 length:207 start_codon:yes stop_codon:yes gene_type:complete
VDKYVLIDNMRNCFKNPKQTLKEIERIDIADVRKLAQKILIYKKLNLIIIGSYKKEDKENILKIIQAY